MTGTPCGPKRAELRSTRACPTLASRSRTSRQLRSLCRSATPAAEAAPGFQQDETIRPYYKKYLSEGELQRHSVREWKDLTAEDVTLPPPTVRSKIAYIFGWLKYNAVPGFVRYLCYSLWSFARRLWYPFHKRAVLQGAKFDVWLQRKARSGQTVTVSRAVALRRFNWKMNAWDDLVYRYDILKAAVLEGLNRRGQAIAEEGADPPLAPPPTPII